MLRVFIISYRLLAFSLASLRSVQNVFSSPALLPRAAACKLLVLKCVCVSARPVVVLPPPPPPLLFLRLMCLSLLGSDSAEPSGRLFVTL